MFKVMEDLYGDLGFSLEMAIWSCIRDFEFNIDCEILVHLVFIV